jgi:hypothetical protein
LRQFDCETSIHASCIFHAWIYEIQRKFIFRASSSGRLWGSYLVRFSPFSILSVKMTTHFSLMLTSRICGALPASPYTLSWMVRTYTGDDTFDFLMYLVSTSNQWLHFFRTSPDQNTSTPTLLFSAVDTASLDNQRTSHRLFMTLWTTLQILTQVFGQFVGYPVHLFNQLLRWKN